MHDAHIMVVDDDPKITKLLRSCFEDEGAVVYEASDGAQALEFAKTNNLQLITLDLNLGSDDGLEVARLIRQVSDVPIIMVTGKDDVIDRVVGLEIGADDYITKPFHIREVLARVKALLRRAGTDRIRLLEDVSSSSDVGNTRQFDGLVAHPDRMELIDRDGRFCELTSGDFKLLNVFLDHPKRNLSRERLMDLINGPEWAPLDRTIDNQVARLRKKIERDPSNPKLIKTVRGIGYMFASEVRQEPGQLSESRA
jgi:DNA-binding response OmpR family regulator